MTKLVLTVFIPVDISLEKKIFRNLRGPKSWVQNPDSQSNMKYRYQVLGVVDYCHLRTTSSTTPEHLNNFDNDKPVTITFATSAHSSTWFDCSNP